MGPSKLSYIEPKTQKNWTQLIVLVTHVSPLVSSIAYANSNYKNVFQVKMMVNIWDYVHDALAHSG